MKRVLITGGTGCIGAVTVHQLLQRDVDEIIVATRSSDPGLLRLWLGDHLDPRVRLLRGDVADESFVRTVFSEHRPSHVIHLGALQGPNCEASPGKGLEINVGGTLHCWRWRANRTSSGLSSPALRRSTGHVTCMMVLRCARRILLHRQTCTVFGRLPGSNWHASTTIKVGYPPSACGSTQLTEKGETGAGQRHLRWP